VTTLYRYEAGPAHVVAEGGWDHAPGFPFFMGFTVVFEHGTAEFALGRAAPLTLSRGGAAEPVPLEQHTGYDGEVRHALAVLAGREEPRATLEEAVGLTRMLAAEKKSLETGRPVRL
jgi:predicted dehydrogenase